MEPATIASAAAGAAASNDVEVFLNVLEVLSLPKVVVEEEEELRTLPEAVVSLTLSSLLVLGFEVPLILNPSRKFFLLCIGGDTTGAEVFLSCSLELVAAAIEVGLEAEIVRLPWAAVADTSMSSHIERTASPPEFLKI